MDNIKISLVSYLNSKPFLYGLRQFELDHNIELDNPSTCAQKLIENKVDLGLVPVAVIPHLSEHYIIGDYCIGAEGKVGSVNLYSNVPLGDIKNIVLDYQSQTSVILTKVLAKFFWKINPTWVPAKVNFENEILKGNGAVIIGDRTFEMDNKFQYTYDLSEEWRIFTKLPFVFACWVANKKLPESFIEKFNCALKFGIDNRTELIAELVENGDYNTDVADYLNNKIKYNLGASQKKGLDLFLNYMQQLG